MNENLKSLVKVVECSLKTGEGGQDDGQVYKRVAGELGVEPGTLRTRVSRGRAMARAELQRQLKIRGLL